MFKISVVTKKIIMRLSNLLLIYLSVIAISPTASGADWYSSTPDELAHAIVRRDLLEVDQILELHPELVDRPSSYGLKNGMLPLVLATWYGQGSEDPIQKQMVELLLSRGASIDIRNAAHGGQLGISDGGTALHIAAADLNTTLIQLLLDYGADPAATDANGLMPYQIAEKEIVEILKSKTRGADFHSFHLRAIRAYRLLRGLPASNSTGHSE